MKLIALKRISDRRPLGCIFEEPNPRAKMLVAIGLAKPYVEPPAEVVVDGPAEKPHFVMASEAKYAPTVSDSPAPPRRSAGQFRQQTTTRDRKA